MKKFHVCRQIEWTKFNDMYMVNGLRSFGVELLLLKKCSGEKYKNSSNFFKSTYKCLLHLWVSVGDKLFLF